MGHWSASLWEALWLIPRNESPWRANKEHRRINCSFVDVSQHAVFAAWASYADLQPFLLKAKSAWWTLGSNGVESDSVIPAASPRDLELDFPSSLSADRESKTSTTLACDSASKIVIASQMVQHNGKAYISNNQNDRKKRTFVKAADDDSRVRNNFFPSQLLPCSIEHDPWSPVFYF